MLDRIALLIGLFAVPLIALKMGNRFRDQSPPKRRFFWGAVIGHMLGMTVTVIASMFPPIWWEGGTVLRDYLVHWSMLVGSVIGVLAAQLGNSGEKPETRTQRT